MYRAKQILKTITKVDWFPLHPVSDTEEIERLKTSILTKGWRGRPLVLLVDEEHYENEDLNQQQAITGSHRTAAIEAILEEQPEIDVEFLLLTGTEKEMLDLDSWTTIEYLRRMRIFKVPEIAIENLRKEHVTNYTDVGESLPLEDSDENGAIFQLFEMLQSFKRKFESDGGKLDRVSLSLGPSGEGSIILQRGGAEVALTELTEIGGLQCGDLALPWLGKHLRGLVHRELTNGNALNVILAQKFRDFQVSANYWYDQPGKWDTVILSRPDQMLYVNCRISSGEIPDDNWPFVLEDEKQAIFEALRDEIFEQLKIKKDKMLTLTDILNDF